MVFSSDSIRTIDPNAIERKLQSLNESLPTQIARNTVIFVKNSVRLRRARFSGSKPFGNGSVQRSSKMLITALAVETLSVSLLAWMSLKAPGTLAGILTVIRLPWAILRARQSLSLPAMTLAMIGLHPRQSLPTHQQFRQPLPNASPKNPQFVVVQPQLAISAGQAHKSHTESEATPIEWC
jgi:hypothetical protein